MRLFKRIAIVGVGLIGGSLGMAVKRAGIAGEVIGVSRRAATIARARAASAIDRGSRSLSCIRGADCVILAAPVSVIMERAVEIAGIVDPLCIVSDVGSTKKEIVGKLERIFPRFVGAHPMAGSHERGVAAARADLFRGSLCILTPTSRTDPEALKRINALWHSVGARTRCLRAHRHDAVMSRVSHLPHALAFSLMNSIPAALDVYAAGGCRDTTRIAASDEKLWCDIFLTNASELLKSARVFKGNFGRLESALRRGDRRLLINLLRKARLGRERLGAAGS